MTDYITSDDVKASLVLDATTYADPDIDRGVAAANAAIDQLFGRKFVPDLADDNAPAPTDRYYSVRRRSREVVEIRDLTRLTDITVAFDSGRDQTFAQTLVENVDFFLEPLNAEADGVPFEQIRAVRGSFAVGSRVLKVSGTFGWPGIVGDDDAVTANPPAQIVAFAEVLAVKFLTRIREAPFGVVTAGADMGVAMRLARTDPDFPTLSAGLCRGAFVS